MSQINGFLFCVIIVIGDIMIDTHCHLSKKDYDNLEEVIKKMEKHIIIISGIDDESNKEVIELCNKYDNIYGTLGIHPSEVDNITEEIFQFIEENLNNKKIVAVGEIGLDYYWVKDNKEKQKEIFIKQIEIAKKHNKPIVVHSRDAINDIYDILKDYNIKTVLHCFTSSIEMANKFIKLGVKLGIGGVVTFSNAKTLKEVVKEIDLKHLLLETDSPYLSPDRGKKNEPYNVIKVADQIARIKGINPSLVIEKTTSNAVAQFDLNVKI